ncbi:MAG: YtxH domain-containing protein [Bryobacteraceae bacterium]|jgi:gas vesicle protein
MEDQNKIPYFFLGLGLGVAVGLLFAPKSGAETRDLLLTKADEGKDYLRRTGEQLRDSASDALDKGKTVVAKQRDQFSSAIEAGKQAYRDALSQSGAASTSEGA